jgi:hypothetical protein
VQDAGDRLSVTTSKNSKRPNIAEKLAQQPQSIIVAMENFIQIEYNLLNSAIPLTQFHKMPLRIIGRFKRHLPFFINFWSSIITSACGLNRLSLVTRMPSTST